MKNANLRLWSIFLPKHWQKREYLLRKYTALGPFVIARASWLQLTDKPGFKLSHLGWIRPRIISSCWLPDLLLASAAGSSAVLPSVNSLGLYIPVLKRVNAYPKPSINIHCCFPQFNLLLNQVAIFLPPNLSLYTCKAPAMTPHSCWLYYLPTPALWPLLLLPSPHPFFKVLCRKEGKGWSYLMAEKTIKSKLKKMLQKYLPFRHRWNTRDP